MKTESVERGVTRIEIPSNNTFGWMARIARKGMRRNEFFSDHRFGGSSKAKQSALKQYHDWEEELPPAETSHEGVITRRNKSGIVGVYVRCDVPKSKPHLEYYFWVATWLRRDGVKCNKSFSWNKYGEEGARELACIARDLRTQANDEIGEEYKRRHQRSGILKHFGSVDFFTRSEHANGNGHRTSATERKG